MAAPTVKLKVDEECTAGPPMDIVDAATTAETTNRRALKIMETP